MIPIGVGFNIHLGPFFIRVICITDEAELMVLIYFYSVCNTYNPNKERTEMNVEPNTNRDYSGMASIPDYRSYPMGSRGISLEVVNHFQVKMLSLIHISEPTRPY